MKLLAWTPALLAVLFLGCSAQTVSETAGDGSARQPAPASEARLEIAQEPLERPAHSSPHTLRLNELQRRASEGDVDALAELATIAESGDAWAQHVLGITYNQTNRSGVHPEAAKWFRKAAAQGVLYSVAALGFSYAHGKGIEKDMERGVGLLRAAADMGESFSQYNLGDLYRAPGGLPKDLAQTYAWHAIMMASLPESPSVTNPATQAKMIEVTQFRLDRLAQKMTPEQIAEGERIAAQWRRKSWDEVRDDVRRFL